MIDIALRPGHTTDSDIVLSNANGFGFGLQLFPGHTSGNDVSNRPQYYYRTPSGAVVFPTQYSGLRTYYSGAVKELCLVAEVDAPGSMGGVLKIRKGGTSYAVYLVDTTDTNASSLRIRTSTGVKSVRLKT